MKKTLIILILAIVLFTSACSNNSSTTTLEASSVNSTKESTTDPASNSTPSPEVSPTPTSMFYPTPKVAFGSQPGYNVTKLAQLGKGILSCMKVSPNGGVAALCSSSGIYLYDVDSFSPIRILDSNVALEKIIFSPDGNLIAGKPNVGSISVWSVESSAPLFTYETKQATYFSAFDRKSLTFDFSPDGQTLAVLIGQELTFLNAKSGEVVRQNLFPADVGYSFVHYSSAHSLILINYDTLGDKKNSGFTWFDPSSNTVGEQVVFPNINSVAFSADQKILAAGDSTGKLKLFDALDGQPLAANISVGSGVNDLEFSPDSSRLAASLFGKQVCVWSVTDGSVQACITEGIDNTPDRIRFSSDGKYLLASYQYSEKANIWETDTWKAMFNPGSVLPIQSVEPLTDNSGKFLLGVEGGLALWNINPVLRHQHTAPGEVTSLVYSPDEKTLVAAGNWGIEILDTGTGQVLTSITDGATLLNFSIDNQTFAAARPDGSVALYSRDGSLLRTLNGLTKPATLLTFLQKGTTLIASGPAETRLWNVSDGTPLPNPEGDPLDMVTVLDGEFFTDPQIGNNLEGNFLSFDNDLSKYRIWRISDGKRAGKVESALLKDMVKGMLMANMLPENRAIVLKETALYSYDLLYSVPQWEYPLENISPRTFLAENANGSVLALFGADMAVIVSGGGKLMRQYQGQFTALALSYTGKETALAAGSDLQVWDNSIAPINELHDFEGTDGSFNLAYAQSGQKIDSTLPDKPVLLWGDWNSIKMLNPVTGEMNGTLTIPTINRIHEITYSNDMELYAFVGEIGDLHIVKASGEQVKVEKLENYQAKNLSFTSDGKYLAGVVFLGMTQMLNVWDTASGRIVSSIQDPTWVYDAVAFAPDGKTLAVVVNGKLCIYDTTIPSSLSLIQTLEIYGSSLAFTPDGKYLAVGFGGTSREAGKVRLLNAQNQWAEALTIKAHAAAVQGLLFLPDGKILVSTGADGTLRFWGLSK